MILLITNMDIKLLFICKQKQGSSIKKILLNYFLKKLSKFHDRMHVEVKLSMLFKG